MWFFVQLCSSWQDFNWPKASRGPCAIAVLLVSSRVESSYVSGGAPCRWNRLLCFFSRKTLLLAKSKRAYIWSNCRMWLIRCRIAVQKVPDPRSYRWQVWDPAVSSDSVSSMLWWLPERRQNWNRRISSILVNITPYLIGVSLIWYIAAVVKLMAFTSVTQLITGKGKGFPYSIPSVGPRADPGVQAVSLQVTVSHPPGGRLPLLSARPAVTSPAAEHHRRLCGTKLYCLVTEAHRCKQLA